MDYERAKEILHSPEYTPVYFMGSSVWLTDLHPDRLTVDIAKDQFSTQKTREVSVSELTEGNELS